MRFENKYYKYNEMVTLLRAYEAEFPTLIKNEVIGHSYEGRDIYAVKLTNYLTGDDSRKPAVCIDANIHALEVSTTSVCLYFIEKVLTNYGIDEKITRAMDTRAFYLVPRISPDGAELCLEDDPKVVRSSVRPYPYTDEPLGGGLLEKDLDGDTRILTMRFRDPNGTWKKDTEHPALMVKRDPTEVGGEYYRILPEGLIEDFDGDNIDVRSLHAQVTWPKGSWPKEGLDLNRTLPCNWRPESEQLGAGSYPVSEPEMKAVVDFIVNHRNIVTNHSLHTFGAVILRPMDGIPDDEMIPEDLRMFDNMCQVAHELTTYPAMSSYPNFSTRPNMIYAGAMDSWLYDHLGTVAWGVEFWNPFRHIGRDNYHIQYFKWFSDHKIEDDVKLYQWAKENFGNDGYVDWYEFDHPQLGKVELGGWNWMHTWANIPEKYQKQEAELFADWFVWGALVSPLLRERKTTVKKLGENKYHVRFVVENCGYLSTYATKKALERNIRGLICELKLPDGVRLLSGKCRQDIGQLEGYVYKDAFLNPKQEGSNDFAVVDWILEAPVGSEIKIVARHDRAGYVEKSIILN